MDGGITARFGSSFTADQLLNGLTIPVLQPTPDGDTNRETGFAGASSGPLTTITCDTCMIVMTTIAIDVRGMAMAGEQR
jgi:hypothetical protein